jgi:hypothetical protein
MAYQIEDLEASVAPASATDQTHLVLLVIVVLV